MKILLTGSDGQIGHELILPLSKLGEVVAPPRSDLELAHPDDIVRQVRDLRPDVIVNAAAYTRVDEAGSHVELARAVNAHAPSVLADEARRSGAILVHYSTDYVFDGEKPEPYTEEDSPAPVNVYGETKLAGEEAIRASGARHLIVRISWVYGLRHANFLTTMLRLFREREEVAVVQDQTGGPTWSRSIAEATAEMLAKVALRDPARESEEPRMEGTFHLSAAGSTSWFTFASAILDRARALCGDDAIVTRRVVPIGMKDYPTPALRPKNSLLSNRKIQSTFGIELPSWSAQLDSCLAGLDK